MVVYNYTRHKIASRCPKLKFFPVHLAVNWRLDQPGWWVAGKGLDITNSEKDPFKGAVGVRNRRIMTGISEPRLTIAE